MASSSDDLLTFTNPSKSSPIVVSAVDSFLLDPNNTASVSGSFQNEGFLAALDSGGSSGSYAEFGLSRTMFRQSAIIGTVDYYECHVFLCYKNPQMWLLRIKAAEFDRLPRLLSTALAASKGGMKR